MINKHIKTLLSAVMLLAIITGCSDPSDFRKVRNEALTNLQRGGMIDFDDIRVDRALRGDDPNTSVFRATIYDPNNNAVSYNVGIDVGGTRVQLGDTYTSFPVELEITGAQIQAALGRPLNLLEIFEITGEVTIDNGNVFTSERLTVTTNNGETVVTGGGTDPTLLVDGSPQALVFSLVTVCGTPPAPSGLVGTWRVTRRSGSGRVTQNIIGNDVQIVAGPGPISLPL